MHRPYPPANYPNAPLKRQQTKAVPGRKLKKTEERSRRNDEAHAANSARCNRIPATVALSRRQTTVLTKERRDQERRHRETLSANQRTYYTHNKTPSLHK